MLTTFSIRQQTLDFVSLNTAVSQTFCKPNRVDIMPPIKLLFIWI